MPQGWRLAASRLQQRFRRANNTIWFYPVALLAGSIALFAITTTLDKSNAVSFSAIQPATTGDFMIFTGSPNAARSVLTAIATGWATILGAVFSISLVVVQLTASNYTPQVLTQFEKDKRNQWSLGSYIGAITYALLVLKTVRTGEGGQTLFTPVVGTNVAIVWAVIDLIVLALYIANLISFIRPHRFVESTVASTIEALPKALAPREQPWVEVAEVDVDKGVDALHLGRREIRADRDGVVARLAWKDLLDELRTEMARALRLGRQPADATWRLRVDRPAGAAVAEGDLLAIIEAPLAGEDLDRLRGALQRAFEVTSERRPEENPGFGLVLLGAIAVRAAADGASQVVVEGVDGLFSVLTRIVGLPPPATELVGRVNGARLLVAERPAVDLFEVAISALAQAVDAALGHQLAAPVEEMATRSAYLILREARARHPATVRRLVEAVAPLFLRALLRLEEPRSLLVVAGEWASLAETLVKEGLEAEAGIVISRMEPLLADVASRPEAAAPLREGLVLLHKRSAAEPELVH